MPYNHLERKPEEQNKMVTKRTTSKDQLSKPLGRLLRLQWWVSFLNWTDKKENLTTTTQIEEKEKEKEKGHQDS